MLSGWSPPGLSTSLYSPVRRLNGRLTRAAQPRATGWSPPGLTGLRPMPVEALTYADLAERLHISPEAARALAKRLRLPRSRANTGKALVSGDLAEIRHTPVSGRSPGGDQSVVPILKAEVERLQAALIRLEALAAGHRADFERERTRSERLMFELLEAVTDRTAAREKVARLEGELTARPRPWWMTWQAARLAAQRRFWWQRIADRVDHRPVTTRTS